MRIIFTLITSLLLSANLWACSWSNKPSFCMGVQHKTVIYGRVVDTIPHGAKIEVLDVFGGIELRDTVTVWESFFWCMDTTYLPVSLIGGIGDSAFFMLPAIDSSIHGWDIIGDYRLDNVYAEELILNIRNDSVVGFIKGIAANHPTQSMMSYPINAFIDWLESGENCSTLVSIHEVSLINNISIYPNPTTDYISIDNLPLEATLEILSIDGQHLGDVSMSENRFSTAHLAAGSYLLKISYEGETGFRRIVKL